MKGVLTNMIIILGIMEFLYINIDKIKYKLAPFSSGYVCTFMQCCYSNDNENI